jgi:hypothetical protein
MNHGDTKYLEQVEDFTKILDESNEELVSDFILGSISNELRKFKSKNLPNSAEIKTLEDFHRLNISRLQNDEKQILEKNLKELSKMLKSN